MYTYIRRVQYHETDKMGITHHSNYVKWMEEARVACLEYIGLPFQSVEKKGIASPVTGLSVEYKRPTEFGDEIAVDVVLRKFTGVKLEIGYTVRNISTGETAAEAVSKHCFLKDGKIVSLKREEPDMYNILTDSLSADK